MKREKIIELALFCFGKSLLYSIPKAKLVEELPISWSDPFGVGSLSGATRLAHLLNAWSYILLPINTLARNAGQ